MVVPGLNTARDPQQSPTIENSTAFQPALRLSTLLAPMAVARVRPAMTTWSVRPAAPVRWMPVSCGISGTASGQGLAKEFFQQSLVGPAAKKCHPPGQISRPYLSIQYCMNTRLKVDE